VRFHTEYIWPGVIVLAIVGFAWLAVDSIRANEAAAARCSERGGTWYKPYKSSGICVAPEFLR